MNPYLLSILIGMHCGEQASEDVAKSLQQIKGMLNGDGGKFPVSVRPFIRRDKLCPGITAIPIHVPVCSDTLSMLLSTLRLRTDYDSPKADIILL